MRTTSIRPTRPALIRVAGLLAVLAIATTAEAGPPLICRQFDAGTAKLLPWNDAAAGTNWNSPDQAYDVKNLPRDLGALLSPDAPIFARMENMRRAVIYASRDESVAAELLRSVLARAQADAGRGADPLAWFDAGYLVESLRQATHIYAFDMFSSGAEKAAWKLRDDSKGVDGYAMVKKALTVGGQNAEIEFAASLMRDGAARRRASPPRRCRRSCRLAAREEPRGSLTTSTPARGRATPRPRRCRFDRPIPVSLNRTPGRVSTRHRGFKLPVLVYIRSRCLRRRTSGVSQRSDKARVLVVDDEESNRKLLTRLLGREYDVVTLPDGEEALALLERADVDVVLLDVRLPGLDGFEVCSRLKMMPRTRLVPVVLVTGLDAREHRLRGIHVGADDFLTKPFDAEELHARLASLVRLKGYTDDLESAEAILKSLALTIDARDPYTDGHCERSPGSRSRSAARSASRRRGSRRWIAAATCTTSARSASPMRSCSSRRG